MRVAAVQTTATDDREESLAHAGRLVVQAADAGAELVVLPEYFSVAGPPEFFRSHAEHLDGPTLTWAREIARSRGVFLLAGSFPEQTGPDHELPDARLANLSVLVGPDGGLLATYRKIHLFDVVLDGRAHRESDTFAPGTHAVAAALPGTDDGEGSPLIVGLTVCYDLRFPELYRTLALAGARVFTVPAAFTAITGPAHWETLLRARAIENEVFVVAAAQVGTLPRGMPACHGHSMIIDPWGHVLAAETGGSPGVIWADLDLPGQSKIRRDLPVLENRRPSAYRLKS